MKEAILSCGLTDVQLADPRVRETMRVPIACRRDLTHVCFLSCPVATVFKPREGFHIVIVPDPIDLSDLEEKGNPFSNLLGC